MAIEAVGSGVSQMNYYENRKVEGDLKAEEKEREEIRPADTSDVTESPRYDRFVKSSGEIPAEGGNIAPKKAEEQPSDGSGEDRKVTDCTVNTDKVDAEIKRLKEEKQKLEEELQKAGEDERKRSQVEKRLSAIEAEIAAKDNDAYRKQNATYTYGGE